MHAHTPCIFEPCLWADMLDIVAESYESIRDIARTGDFEVNRNY